MYRLARTAAKETSKNECTPRYIYTYENSELCRHFCEKVQWLFVCTDASLFVAELADSEFELYVVVYCINTLYNVF